MVALTVAAIACPTEAARAPDEKPSSIADGQGAPCCNTSWCIGEETKCTDTCMKKYKRGTEKWKECNQYCSKTLPRSQLNLDHVVPRSQGGRTSWENVVCSCVKCNLTKGGRRPEQAGMKLLKVPARPSWSSLTPSFGKVPYKEWLPFLDPVTASYWNTELLDEDEGVTD
jgi:hypothetical protein